MAVVEAEDEDDALLMARLDGVCVWSEEGVWRGKSRSREQVS